MKTQSDHSVVAVYDTHIAAEAAVHALQAAGLDMSRLSIVGKNLHTEENVVGFYTLGDRMRFWGMRGAFWGGLWGVLFGGAFFFLPAIGPIVAMGPLVVALSGMLEGAAVGSVAGMLGAALVEIGIPVSHALKYEVDVKAGKFLVIANGPADVIERARGVLAPTGAHEITAQPVAPRNVPPQVHA
jgi:hypothetical protein